MEGFGEVDQKNHQKNRSHIVQPSTAQKSKRSENAQLQLNRIPTVNRSRTVRRNVQPSMEQQKN